MLTEVEVIKGFGFYFEGQKNLLTYLNKPLKYTTSKNINLYAYLMIFN